MAVGTHIMGERTAEETTALPMSESNKKHPLEGQAGGTDSLVMYSYWMA